MDKKKTLDLLADGAEERALLSHLADLADRAGQKNIPAASEFLTPAEQRKAELLMEAMGFSNYAFFGGFAGAERKCLVCAPDWGVPEEEMAGILAMEATFFPGEPLNHRDFLGSLMGLGVQRKCLGDILVKEDSAIIFAVASMESFFLTQWESAGHTRLNVKKVALSDVAVPEPTYKTIRDTVASLRLDAVLSTGFSMSRGKALEYINAGHVQVNYLPCTKADQAVKQGDIFSVRGLGKCLLDDCSGLSKKGRIGIIVKRFM